MDQIARAAYYRNKAEEVRIIAEAMNSAENRRILLTVAADYEMLAFAVEHLHLADPIPASV